jgi:hypothetical protein
MWNWRLRPPPAGIEPGRRSCLWPVTSPAENVQAVFPSRPLSLRVLVPSGMVKGRRSGSRLVVEALGNASTMGISDEPANQAHHEACTIVPNPATPRQPGTAAERLCFSDFTSLQPLGGAGSIGKRRTRLHTFAQSGPGRRSAKASTGGSRGEPANEAHREACTIVPNPAQSGRPGLRENGFVCPIAAKTATAAGLSVA